MSRSPVTIQIGPGPLIASAIHDGSAVSADIEANMALAERERRREEDPFTAAWTVVAPTTIVGLRSRFEVDLNRPREAAIYRTPEQAWGLNVWKRMPTDDLVVRVLAGYDTFYEEVKQLLDEKVREHGRFIVLDLHSYNHRRGGPHALPAPHDANPEINVGTATLRMREPWARLIDRFIADLRQSERPNGTSYDVRENVKFGGGQFGRWIHDNYPKVGCCLSIEVKKFFMDEWTGVPDQAEIDAVRNALTASVPGLLEELHRI